MAVLLPIDDLAKKWPKELHNARIGAVLHPASVGTSLEHSAEILQRHNGSLFELKCFFGPQHGIHGHTQDNMIEWEGGIDPKYGIPVYSLYGKHRKPTTEMFEEIDALLIDLQDVGVRYYTFIWTMFLCMERAEEMGKTIVVADRPNPIGNKVEGPVLDLDHSSFVGLHSIPVRHGKTIGQLAVQFKNECFPKLKLEVMEMENWEETMYFDKTGLPWVLPSPNIPTLDTVIVYPGTCLFEATNVSEGRGTTRPFELFGAPFINSEKLCSHMNSLNLTGAYFRECHFQPTFDKWAGEICNGAQIHVSDRSILKPFETGIEILKFLYHEYPKDFSWRTEPFEYEYEKLAIDILLGSGWYRKKYIEEKFFNKEAVEIL